MTRIAIHGHVALNELYALYDELIRANRRSDADRINVIYHETRAIISNDLASENAADTIAVNGDNGHT